MNAPDERTALEVEYWRALLHDVLDLNESIGRAADCVSNVPVAVLEGLLVPQSERGAKLLEASNAASATMNELHGMYGPITRVLALVDGRLKALGIDDDNHSRRVEPAE